MLVNYRGDMKRVVTKIGHIFCVEIDGVYKCFFQFIAVDETELNSTVIRVFKTHYPMDYKPNLDEIVKDNIDFYAHVLLNDGVRNGSWYRVGKHSNLENIDNIMFKDYEYITSTERADGIWFVWIINGETMNLGRLLPEMYKDIPDGGIFPDTFIIRKIKTGHYYNHIHISAPK